MYRSLPREKEKEQFKKPISMKGGRLSVHFCAWNQKVVGTKRYTRFLCTHLNGRI